MSEENYIISIKTDVGKLFSLIESKYFDSFASFTCIDSINPKLRLPIYE